MPFKLVRTDSEQANKVPLSSGTHLIGRGKLLDCDDKRISRNHGEIEVGVNSIKIKALHQNPCFYTKKGSTNVNILNLNSEVHLDNCDKFGLLPDAFWYEVIHCDIEQVNKEEILSVNWDETETQQVTGELEATSLDPETGNRNNEDEDQPLNFNLEESLRNENRPESPSIMGTERNPEILPQVNVDQQNGTPVVSQCYDEMADSEEAHLNIKRHHTPEKSPVDEKKVKIEPEDIKSEDQPGPSTNQVNSAGVPQMPPSPQKNPTRNRERCLYGENCYRRNPGHKSEFSHPGDSDWGNGDRGECPWGRTCRRRDPRHWQHHVHPPGTVPPAERGKNATQSKNRVTQKKRRSRTSSGSSQDSPSQNLIVFGKRQRKTVSKVSSWSGSDTENEDPYRTDESDEWQPNKIMKRGKIKSNMDDSESDNETF